MTDFVDAFSTFEAVTRRHLPTCMRLFDLALKPLAASTGNSAPFEVIAYVQRISPEPDPGGWVHALAEEIRRGWDGTEFSFRVQHLPSEYPDVMGRYSE